MLIRLGVVSSQAQSTRNSISSWSWANDNDAGKQNPLVQPFLDSYKEFSESLTPFCNDLISQGSQCSQCHRLAAI